MRDITNVLSAIVSIPVVMTLMVAYPIYCLGVLCQLVLEELMATQAG